jgi:hypothetical protein
LRGRRRARGQVDGAGREAQALAQAQVDVAVEAHQAVGHQREVVEAARGDAVHADACAAVGQRGFALAGLERGRQRAVALRLRQHQFARHAHRVVHVDALQVLVAHHAVVGCFQAQRQRAAGRARATGRGAQAAVEEQAAVGGQRDQAAVAGHRHRAAPRQVEVRRGARGIEPRARAQHHEGICRVDQACVGAVGRADLNAPASAHAAVYVALRIDRRVGAAGGVEHRVLADPDRGGIGRARGAVHVVAGAEGARQHADAAAPGIERAVDGDLGVACEHQAAARVHRDRGALPHHQRRLAVDRARAKGQVGAGALREHALQRVFLPQRRQPALQHRRRIGTGGRGARRGRVGPQHRHGHLELRAVGHLHALLGVDGVAREAAAKQAVVEHQQRLDRHVGRQPVAGHEQRAFGQHHVACERRAAGHRGGVVGHGHAVGERGGGHHVARRHLAGDVDQFGACRHGAAAGVDAARLAVDDHVLPGDGRLRHHPGGGQRVGARGREHRHQLHRLARRDGVGDVAEVARQHGARGNGEGLGQREVHRHGFAGRQLAGVEQHAAAQGHADAGVDGERAAALHAVAAQLAVEQQRAGAASGGVVLVGAQRDVPAAPALHGGVGHHGGARRGVDERAGVQPHVAGAGNGHAAAVQVRQAGDVARVHAQVGPQAARVQHHAAGHVHARRVVLGRHADDGLVEPGRAAAFLQPSDHVAQRDAAAARREVGIDVELRRVQRNGAAVAHGHIGVERDAARGVGLEGAQVQGVEPAGVELDLAREFLGQCVFQPQAVGHALHGADVDAFGRGLRAVAQHAGAYAGVEHRAQLADDELAGARRRRLRLPVGVERRVGCVALAVALEHGGLDVAFEHRRGGAHHHAARVAAHGVAVFQPLARADQRVVEELGGVLAPALVRALEAAVHAAVEHVARRARQVVEPPVVAHEPALLEHAGLHVERAARHVDGRARARDELAPAEGHRAARGGPFADAVAAGVQVAADFEQAAAGVPALGGVAVGAGRHAHQVAAVDPEVGVVQVLAVAVERCVALLVALHVHLDVVRGHGHAHAHRARDVDGRALGNQRAARRAHVDLAAGGQRHRVGLERHAAAGHHLHQRQVAPVVHAVGQRGRVLHEAVALHVERGGVAVVEQHGADAAGRQRDARVGVARRGQVQRAARGDAGARQQHARLLHGVAGQRDVAAQGLHQARVGHPARAAVLVVGGRDLVAARARLLVAVGAQALLDDEAVAGRQHGLPAGRDDGAVVVRLAPGQQHVAAALGHGLRLARGNARAGLDDHVAGGVAVAGGGGGRGQVVGQRGHEAGAQRLAVDAAPELRVAHAHGRSQQVARVDLAAAAEDDAVAVDHHDGAVGLYLALDLRGPRLRVVHAVEHRPAGLLLELQRGVLADVEGLPIQYGLVAALRDRDLRAPVGLRLHRCVGVGPARGEAGRVHAQAAFGQAVGHAGLAALANLERRAPCGFLRRLSRRDAPRGDVQVADGTLQLLGRALLLRLRAGERRRGHAVGQAAGGRGGALGHVLLRHPGAAEGLLRVRALGRGAGRQHQRDGMHQRREAGLRKEERRVRIAPGHRAAALHADFHGFVCHCSNRCHEARARKADGPWSTEL